MLWQVCTNNFYFVTFPSQPDSYLGRYSMNLVLCKFLKWNIWTTLASYVHAVFGWCWTPCVDTETHFNPLVLRTVSPVLYILQVIKELEFEGAVDIKSCPHSCHKLACVLDKDLWLMNADNGEKTRLTFSHTPETDLLSAGQPSFISQVSVCMCFEKFAHWLDREMYQLSDWPSDQWLVWH